MLSGARGAAVVLVDRHGAALLVVRLGVGLVLLGQCLCHPIVHFLLGALRSLRGETKLRRFVDICFCD